MRNDKKRTVSDGGANHSEAAAAACGVGKLSGAADISGSSFLPPLSP